MALGVNRSAITNDNPLSIRSITVKDYFARLLLTGYSRNARPTAPVAGFPAFKAERYLLQ